MKSKARILGLGCLLLAVLFVGFGCEMPWNKATESTTNTGTTGGGTTGGGTTGGGTTSGTQYTASGTYTYSSNIFSLTTTTSTFPANDGPENGTTETFTVSSLTATQMLWSSTDSTDVFSMTWMRSSGTAGVIAGTWTMSGAGESGGDSYTLILNSNGSWSVTGHVVAGTTGGTTGSTTGNMSGTWEGTYTDNFTSDPYGYIGSGIVRFTFNQTGNFITGTGFTQAYGGLSNNSTVTAGQVNGNNLGVTLRQTGSDGSSSWTTTTQVSGTVSGNTVTGNYRADTVVSGSGARTYMTVGTYTLTKR